MDNALTQFFLLLQSSIGFLPLLGLVYIVAMVMFWYETKHVGKNRNSVFDMWFFSTFGMIVWGRVTYLMLNWGDYAIWNWFYLPYEKYGDQIYLFRAMPWRLLSVWDGGFLFIPMFLVYVLLGYIFVVHIKKWRWREMITSILFSANFFLGTTLFIYGAYLDDTVIAKGGLIIFITAIAFQIFLNSLKRIYRSNIFSYVMLGQILILLYLVLDILLLTYIFLSQEISDLDRYHVYAFILFGVYMAVAYVLDIRKGEDVPAKPEKKDPDIMPVRVNLNRITPADEE